MHLVMHMNELEKSQARFQYGFTALKTCFQDSLSILLLQLGFLTRPYVCMTSSSRFPVQ